MNRQPATQKGPPREGRVRPARTESSTGTRQTSTVAEAVIRPAGLRRAVRAGPTAPVAFAMVQCARPRRVTTDVKTDRRPMSTAAAMSALHAKTASVAASTSTVSPASATAPNVLLPLAMMESVTAQSRTRTAGKPAPRGAARAMRASTIKTARPLFVKRTHARLHRAATAFAMPTKRISTAVACAGRPARSDKSVSSGKTASRSLATVRSV